MNGAIEAAMQLEAILQETARRSAVDQSTLDRLSHWLDGTCDGLGLGRDGASILRACETVRDVLCPESITVGTRRDVSIFETTNIELIRWRSIALLLGSAGVDTTTLHGQGAELIWTHFEHNGVLPRVWRE